MKKAPMALVVMSAPERVRPLRRELHSLSLDVLVAKNCREARRVLQSHPPLGLVITDLSHADGNWCDVFTCLVEHGLAASVVVSSPLADERLWSEVLWRGGYDVLVEPYERGEVRRVIEGALRGAHLAGLYEHPVAASAQDPS